MVIQEQSLYASTAQVFFPLQLAMVATFFLAFAGLALRLERPVMRALALLWAARLLGASLQALRAFPQLPLAIEGVADVLFGAIILCHVPLLWLIAELVANPESTRAARFRPSTLVPAAAVGALIGLMAHVTGTLESPTTHVGDSAWRSLMLPPTFLLAAFPIWRRWLRIRDARARLTPLVVGITIIVFTTIADESLRALGLAAGASRVVPTAFLAANMVMLLVFGVTCLLTALEAERDAIMRNAEALRLAGVRAMQSQRLASLGLLAGGVAHDFNNLLTVIRSGAEVARVKLPAHNESAREELEAISAATDRGASLTAELLAYARQQPISPRAFVPSASIKAMQPLIQRMVGRGVTLDTNLTSTARVEMDPTQFEQAMMNLAVNAHAAMPDGGVLRIEAVDDSLREPRVVEDTELRPGAYVRIRVGDTGTGMTEDVLRHLFDPFFTTKGEHGTGLGLATVFSAVRQARGDITVESAPGKGTQFEIWLPAI